MAASRSPSWMAFPKSAAALASRRAPASMRPRRRPQLRPIALALDRFGIVSRSLLPTPKSGLGFGAACQQLPTSTVAGECPSEIGLGRFPVLQLKVGPATASNSSAAPRC